MGAQAQTNKQQINKRYEFFTQKNLNIMDRLFWRKGDDFGLVPKVASCSEIGYGSAWVKCLGLTRRSWVFGEGVLVDVGWGFNRGEGSVRSVVVLVVGVEYEQVGTQKSVFNLLSVHDFVFVFFVVVFEVVCEMSHAEGYWGCCIDWFIGVVCLPEFNDRSFMFMSGVASLYINE